MYIGNTPFQGLVGGGNILDASIEGVDLSTSAIAARLGYTPVDPGAAAFTATLTAKDIQQDNATYIKGKLAAGTTTRLFGINSSNTLYIGSVDADHTGGTLFVKNGVTQMTLDASSGLTVVGDLINNGGRLSLYRSAGASYIDWASGQNLVFRTETSAGGAGASNLVTLDSTGRLLVGIASSTGANVKLVVGNGLPSSNAVAVINNYNTNIPALSISNWDGTTTSYGPRIAFDNSGRGGFTIGGSDGSNNFDIARTWGTPDLRIDSNGYVGINRTSVRTEFDVTGRARFNSYLAIGRGPNNNDGLFWNITPNTAGTAYTPGYTGSAGAGSAYLGMPSGGNGGLMLKVKRHGTTATDYTESSMTLSTYWDDSGNVGIGNTSPQSRLHVTGSDNDSISFITNAGTAGAVAAALAEIRECGFNVTSGSNFRISNITTSATGWRAVFRGTWSNNYEGGGLTPPAPYIEINAANNSFAVGSRTLIVTRDANGYLIANTTDAYRISFAGSIEIYENPQSGQPTNSIITLGRVGVGVANPSYPLDVSTRLRVGDGTNSLVSGYWDGATNRIESTNKPLFLTSYNDSIRFGISGSENMRITSTGSFAFNPDAGKYGIIRRTYVNGSNGIKIQANAADTVDDTNAGASIQISGGVIGDTYEGNIDITAYGSIVDSNRNQIRFWNRSGTNTTQERMRIDHNGRVLIGTTAISANAANGTLALVNGGLIVSDKKFATNSGSFYNTTAGGTRNITISGMGSVGEYYAKLILVGLSEYAGSAYFTKIIEFTGYGAEGRVATIATSGATGGSNMPSVAVTATTTTVNIAVTFGSNYRCVAYLESAQGTAMYISGVSGTNA